MSTKDSSVAVKPTTHDLPTVENTKMLYKGFDITEKQREEREFLDVLKTDEELCKILRNRIWSDYLFMSYKTSEGVGFSVKIVFDESLKQAIDNALDGHTHVVFRHFDGFSPIPNIIFLVVCNMFHDSDWVLTTDAMAVGMNWFKNDINVLTINFFGK